MEDTAPAPHVPALKLPAAARVHVRGRAADRVHPGAVLVEQERDGRIQAQHHGHAVLLDAGGGPRAVWGEPRSCTYWRSAPKPLQALPFVRGAYRSMGYGQEDLALACGSHSSEPFQVGRARAMLDRAGLDETALRCGSHEPITRHAGPSPPGGWSAIHNNCSGKHAAMLAACVEAGWETATYTEPAHPLQRDILGLVRAATGETEVPIGGDGCGVPTFWAPVVALARTYQWLNEDSDGGLCLEAMASHPHLVAGTDRFCTALMTEGRGGVVGKVGAEAVYVVLHRPSGAALAVKMMDGGWAAMECFVASVVQRLGWVPEEALASRARRPITDTRGATRGRFRITATAASRLDAA